MKENSLYILSNNFLLALIVGLTFTGFYSAILLALNAGMDSRLIAIPFRILISLICGLLFIKNLKNPGRGSSLFLFFSFLYLLRITIDYLTLEYFYISYLELLFYFLSFCLIPFLSISKARIYDNLPDQLISIFIPIGFLFVTCVIVLYGRFVGQVGRLTEGTTGEEVISPLILSYCGALIIGVVSMYLVFNRTSISRVLIYVLLIGLSTVPFFLGASRGSIFAIFLPYLVLFSSKISFKFFLRILLVLILMIVFLTYLDAYFDSGLLNRFLGMNRDIEDNSSSTMRLDIWKTSFNQFLDNPFFGDKLNTDKYNNYPHNIFIEVLQSIGFIGFIPFSLLVIRAFRASIKIFKYTPKYSWLCVFFLQSFTQNMFSGALYSAVWFWASLAMILAFEGHVRAQFKS